MSGRKKQQNNGLRRAERRAWLGNLVEASELTEDEIFIAVERYQLVKARKAEMRANNAEWAEIRLPGSTGIETPDAEKVKLVQRAKELGVSSGHYEDWEIVQFGNAVSVGRDEGWLDIIEAITLGNSIDLDLAVLATYALTTTGKLWSDGARGARVFPEFVSKERAGDLADRYTQMLIMAKDLEIPFEAIPNPTAFIAGMGNMLTSVDDGEAFRRAAAEYVPVVEKLSNYLKHRKTPGAPKQKVIARLLERAKPYIDDGMEYGAAYDQMVADLDKRNLNKDEAEEAVKLAPDNWNADAFERAFVRKYGTVSKPKVKNKSEAT